MFIETCLLHVFTKVLESDTSTSELKLLEEAKIFGKGNTGASLTNYQSVVNEAAGKLVLKQPGLLAHRGIYRNVRRLHEIILGIKVDLLTPRQPL